MSEIAAPPRRPWWRYLWPAPATLIGLLLAAPLLLLGARWRCIDGVLEFAGGRLSRSTGPGKSRFVAITLGHVVLGESDEILSRYRVHEHVHVAQYERWGALFFLAYGASSLLIWLRGGRPYWDNCFEREARAAEQAAFDNDP